MAQLNSGFENNINTITLRSSGSTTQTVTDRAIDYDGDGDVETVSVTVTPRGGNKTKTTYVINPGAPKSIVQQTFEPGRIPPDLNTFYSEGI